LRHRKENLKKCSLRHLQTRADLRFLTYPLERLPDLTGYVVLTLDGRELDACDKSCGLLLLDGTWRYAAQMSRVLPPSFCARSLPSQFKTAYPRRQEDCPDPSRGLASIEALFIAYTILGRDTTGLLDQYYWKEAFLQKNQF
jgi:pre-rRNA-processing protein TSR3